MKKLSNVIYNSFPLLTFNIPSPLFFQRNSKICIHFMQTKRKNQQRGKIFSLQSPEIITDAYLAIWVRAESKLRKEIE